MSQKGLRGLCSSHCRSVAWFACDHVNKSQWHLMKSLLAFPFLKLSVSQNLRWLRLCFSRIWLNLKPGPRLEILYWQWPDGDISYPDNNDHSWYWITAELTPRQEISKSSLGNMSWAHCLCHKRLIEYGPKYHCTPSIDTGILCTSTSPQWNSKESAVASHPFHPHHYARK